jgi:hypothetical protein
LIAVKFSDEVSENEFWRAQFHFDLRSVQQNEKIYSKSVQLCEKRQKIVQFIVGAEKTYVNPNLAFAKTSNVSYVWHMRETAGSGAKEVSWTNRLYSVK